MGDKIGHILSYATVMWWFVQLYPKSRYFLIGGLLIGMGLALEFVQGLTPYRHFDYMDSLANTTGVVIGWLLGATILKINLPKLEQRFPHR